MQLDDNRLNGYLSLCNLKPVVVGILRLREAGTMVVVVEMIQKVRIRETLLVMAPHAAIQY